MRKFLKLIFKGYLVFTMLLILLIVFIIIIKPTPVEPKVKSLETTKTYSIFEAGSTANTDSIFSLYFNNDTFPYILSESKHYDTLGVYMMKQTLDETDDVFAQECFNNWIDNEQDTSLCKEFDYYKNWRNKENFKGVYLDTYKDRNGNRYILFTHSGSCACCNGSEIKSQKVKYYTIDDPRNKIQEYHSDNIRLSGMYEEFLRKNHGAITSFTQTKDSAYVHINRLNNSRYDSTYNDVFIVKKTITSYH